jgi:hypothetical protein
MLAPKLAQCEAWKKSFQVLACNWVTNTIPPLTLSVIDIIWNHRADTSGYTTWLLVQNLNALPLIKAIVKMLNAKEYLKEYGLPFSLSSCQVAEVKALQERGSRERAYAPGEGIHSRVLGCAEEPAGTNLVTKKSYLLFRIGR